MTDRMQGSSHKDVSARKDMLPIGLKREQWEERTNGNTEEIMTAKKTKTKQTETKARDRTGQEKIKMNQMKN